MMKYCSNCATEIVWRIPEGDDRERAVCPECQSIFYDSPRVLVTTFLYCGEKLMWTQRGIEPYKGLWAFPGGYLERGETLQQAAVRELREETGIELPAEHMIPMSLGSVLAINQLYVVFRYDCREEIAAQCTHETQNWQWSDDHDAPWDKMAHPETEAQIRQIYQWLKSGEFSIRVGEVTDNGGRYCVYPLKVSS
jgi:ADP-ribose pyrophosphatase YjhB (NUDIX family)